MSVSERKSRHEENFHTPREPARGIGLLISGRAGIPDDAPVGWSSKSAIDDVGVDVRKDAIYLVSAISRWSRISSRSSMSKAKCSVSLWELVSDRKILMT